MKWHWEPLKVKDPGKNWKRHSYSSITQAVWFRWAYMVSKPPVRNDYWFTITGVS